MTYFSESQEEGGYVEEECDDKGRWVTPSQKNRYNTKYYPDWSFSKYKWTQSSVTFQNALRKRKEFVVQ